jgi:hypothetical protein
LGYISIAATYNSCVKARHDVAMTFRKIAISLPVETLKKVDRLAKARKFGRSISKKFS